MAGVGYTNTVPLGREGSGGAQILGPSRAVQHFLSTDAQNKERLLREQQMFQRTQQGYNQQFNKDLSGISDLSVAPAYQNDLTELTNKLVEQGGKMRSMGVNPYNPNQTGAGADVVKQWNADVAKVKQAKVMADKFFDYKKSIVDRYSKGADFDMDEFNSLLNFEKDNSLLDLVEGRVQLPQVSERLDIDKELKGLGQMYNDVRDYERDEAGNIKTNPDGSQIYRTTRQADIPRIQSVVRNLYTDGSRYAKEVDRDLRKIYGKDASTQGLLRTTDEAEIREILDAEFRNNNSDFSPIAEMMNAGKIKSVDSPEYESFLDMAVQEQLKAERILDDAMQSAGNKLAGRVNTQDYQKLDYSSDTQRIRREAAALNKEKSLLTLDKLRTQKSQGWKTGSGDGDYDLADISNVTIKTDNGADIVLYGATTGSTSEFEYNPTKSSYNIKTQEFDSNERESAKLIGVGVVAVDKHTGKVYPGDPRNYVNNPNASFEVKAQVRASTRRGGRTVKEDFFEDPNVISKSLGGESKKFASRSISNANAVLKEFNKVNKTEVKVDKSVNTQKPSTKKIGMFD